MRRDDRPKIKAIPMPKYTDFINENGDIVYRILYRDGVHVIHKADIERLLNGKRLDNTTIWEVIEAWEEERKSKLADKKPVFLPGHFKSL